MFVLRGFKFDSLQETHPWHAYQINPKDVDFRLAVATHGTDTTWYRGRSAFLFHAPILGGWKQFSVYEVDRANVPFHIGWVMYEGRSGKLIEAAIHKLPIRDTHIRTLDGPPSFHGHFFAVDTNGRQVPLRVTGRGRLGDGKYLSVRLF